MQNEFLKLFLELVESNKSLIEQGTNLKEQDQQQYLKLLDCEIKLSDHVHWEKRREYLNIMKDFVDLKIDGRNFVSQFDQLHRSNEKTVKMIIKDLKQLNSLEINQKSIGFSEWTSEMDLGCDEFYPDFEPEDQTSFKFARDEENFRNFISNILPQIQGYCDP